MSRDYRYIGKDGKTVLARDLEDQRDEALARIEALEAGIIAALREDDANMRPILRKALHGEAGE